VKSLQDVSNIFQTKIPLERKSLHLKIKGKALNILIFHAPECAANEFHTSLTKLLCLSTWLCYFTDLSHKSELKKIFTQYCAWCGLINVVNSKSIHLLWQFTSWVFSILIYASLTDKASSLVWNQIFNHQLNVVRYYLDWEVQFNTIAVFLSCFFNDIV